MPSKKPWFSLLPCGMRATNRGLREDLPPHFSPQSSIKNLYTFNCWSKLRRKKPSGRQLFGGRLKENSASAPRPVLKETQRQRSEEQESEDPRSLSWRNRDARP